LIIFNPPYLPEDSREPEDSKLITTGGKKGYELIERFFSQVSKYIMPYGKILIVFSSLTGKEKVHDIMERFGFNFQKISEEEIFAETLFVYLAEKSDLLKRLESNHIKDIEKITQGHRGLIYKGNLDDKTIVIKKQREDKQIIDRIVNEARWLKVLNRKNIGPKFLFIDDDYFVYEYVKGEFIPEYIKNSSKTNIKKVFTNVFKQCFTLDQMSVNKEEMHNPFKHIIIDKKPVMIDFERMHFTTRPKNVTQFIQYVTSARLKKVLKAKGFNINKKKFQSLAKKYKKDMSEENFKYILNLLN